MVLSSTLSPALGLCPGEVHHQCWVCSVEAWKGQGSLSPVQPPALSGSGLQWGSDLVFLFILCPRTPCLGHRSPATCPLSSYKACGLLSAGTGRGSSRMLRCS